jgi:hypothetical protein
MDPVAGRRVCALALTASILLSGCATTQPAPAGSPVAAATPVARGVAPVPVTTARAMRPRPVTLHDEAAMRALDPAAIKQLIGPPTFVRQDGGATVWQYSARGCVMDLFWYRSDAGPTLLHVEARNIHSPRSTETQACLDELWKERAGEAES